jgi:hypothetical protein
VRKLTNKQIGVTIAIAVVLVTINAWWRVKETGRRVKWVVDHEMLDAGPDAVVSDAVAPDTARD